MSDITSSVRRKKERYAPQGTVPASYRRHIYQMMMVGGILFLNPLVLYRFAGISDALYLQQWFGFADYWSQNDIGGSIVELLVWCAFYLPSYDSIFGMVVPWQFKAIAAIFIGGFGFWYTYRVGYNVWLARRAFNTWAIFFQPMKKALFIGGPVAVAMLLLNWLAGVSFTFWNIFEISSWVTILVLGAVVAAGRLWNRDILRDAGVRGTNATMGDSSDFDDHDHGDGDHY